MKPPSTIITAGDNYTDIDVAAAAHLYAAGHRDATPVLIGHPNASLPSFLHHFVLKYQTIPSHSQVVIVDLSDPDHIAKFVDQSQITQIFDHHPGFEQYWQSRLGSNAHIEPIGAATTLVWEYVEHNGYAMNTINLDVLRLVYWGILSNTLNFRGSITHQRDRLVINQINQLIDTTDLHLQYFTARDDYMLSNPNSFLIHDTKIIQINGQNIPLIQVELWSNQYLEQIIKLVKNFYQPYYWITLPIIEQNLTYQITNHTPTQQWIIDNFETRNTAHGIIIPELILRKQIKAKLNT